MVSLTETLTAKEANAVRKALDKTAAVNTDDRILKKPHFFLNGVTTVPYDVAGATLSFEYDPIDASKVVCRLKTPSMRNYWEVRRFMEAMAPNDSPMTDERNYR